MKTLSHDNIFKISDFPITCSRAVCHFQSAGTKKRDLVYYNISPFHGLKLYFILIFTSFLFLPPEERKQCNISGFVNTNFFCHISCIFQKVITSRVYKFIQRIVQKSVMHVLGWLLFCLLNLLFF